MCLVGVEAGCPGVVITGGTVVSPSLGGVPSPTPPLDFCFLQPRRSFSNQAGWVVLERRSHLVRCAPSPGERKLPSEEKSVTGHGCACVVTYCFSFHPISGCP